MNAIVDSSVWIGLFRIKDDQHLQIKQLFKQKSKCVTLYTVFEETLAVSHARFGKKTSLTIGTYLISSKQNQLIFLTSQDNQSIWKLYQSLPNQIDFVDASVIYFSQKLNLPILTVDKHFHELATHGYPINLAR